jgi:exopolysaccharide production protein ExoZ
MTESRQFFPGIHALRIVAALMVAFEHARFVSNGYDGGPPHLFYPGRSGVILFFAISGFVIALQRTKPVSEFALHRLLRIYPSYWIAIAIEVVFRVTTSRPAGITASQVLLYPSISSCDFTAIPYWSLIFEMMFYALAALVFAMRLSDRTLTLLAVAWILAVNLFASNPANLAEYEFPGSRILLSSVVQVFPIGVLCGIHFDRLRRLGRWPYAIAAAPAFVAGLALPGLSTLHVFAIGMSAAFLIAAVADLPIRSRLVRLLGDASYGVYLLHFPTIVLVATLYSTDVGLGWLLAAAALLGIAFGIFDQWLYRRLIRFTWWRAHRVSAAAP